MSVFSHVDGLGPVLEEALADSVLTWRDEYVKAHKHADVIAEAITSVSADVTLFPGGRATLITEVRGRRNHQDQTQVFRLARKGSGKWVRSDSTIPKA